jgi:hypothetical protein
MMLNATRPTGLAIVLVVLCGACSTPPRSGAVPVSEPAVQARILPPFQGQIVFDVNQPAYVAVFDVRPWEGIEMIYPGPNDEGRAYGGIQSAPIFYLTQADDERRALTTPPIGGGEEYLYLIASRTPLGLGPFADHPIAVSEAAHVLWKSLDPDSQIDSLLRNVVKPLYDADWDSDVLILTPGGGATGTRTLQIASCDANADGGAATRLCAHSDRVVQTLRVAPRPAEAALQSGAGGRYVPGGGTRGAQTTGKATTRAANSESWRDQNERVAMSPGNGTNIAGKGTNTAGSGKLSTAGMAGGSASHMSAPGTTTAVTAATPAPAASTGKP